MDGPKCATISTSIMQKRDFVVVHSKLAKFQNVSVHHLLLYEVLDKKYALELVLKN